ncbi:HSF-type DNA-binding-domain-containing protein [Zychaea mexicana]|uniref:HSF-type DNA-binding-domain-containing protein n=1 Tax=Zychaea mexicana TaxID=64656 RepID=UPI0022FECA6D|nr:HSF-type DNA-binding-domain-containing protein [Zychaea mexicana]KAI9498087.1 HSF-type DNA-binding-domain-containing protein [Zychaea mexicana]
MVEDPAEEQIVWSSNGDYFKVISPSKFSSTTLPQYFRHNNWTSFVRQLNMYGFHKVSEYRDDLNQDTWCFKHTLFYRGGKQSSHLIRRKRVHASDMPEDAESEESTAAVTDALEPLPLEIQLGRIEEAVSKVQTKSQVVGSELRQLKTSVQRQQQVLWIAPATACVTTNSFIFYSLGRRPSKVTNNADTNGSSTSNDDDSTSSDVQQHNYYPNY